MVGVVVITHGQFAPGLKDASRMIVGPQEKFEVLSLLEDTDLDAFKQEVFETIQAVGEKGALVFVDMFGATPFNTVAQLRADIEAANLSVELITGVNLPMLLETLMQRDGADPKALAQTALEAGNSSLEHLSVHQAE